jgi:quinol monooxygenase YgiN
MKERNNVENNISIEKALIKLPEVSGNKAIVLNVTYTVKDGKREEFYQSAADAEIPEKSRLEEGNIRYDYFYPVDSPNQLLLIEVWKDRDSLNNHKETEHFNKLQAIKETYVTDVKFEEFMTVL